MSKVEQVVDRVAGAARVERSVAFHLVMGALLAALLLAVIVVAKVFGLGAALIAGCLVLGIGVEWYQVLRGGEPSWSDAFTTAAAGIAVGIVILVLQRFFGLLQSLPVPA